MKFFSQQLNEAERIRIVKRLGRIVASEQFIGGPEVSGLERALTDMFGRETVTCNSGTDALILGLRALGVVPGDEVITTAFTYFATVESIAAVGAKPVLVDIDPGTFNIDPGLIEGKVTKRTRAVLVVHLFGQACDMRPIVSLCRRRKLFLVEDCAQSFGARDRGRLTGTFGDIGAFSFFPTKNLGGFGDGGAVTARSAALASRLRLLKNHGQPRKYEHAIMGANSRLDTFQAAVLLEKLKRLDRDLATRRRNAAKWIRELSTRDDIIVLPTRHGHTYNVFTVMARDLAAFTAELKRRGIPFMRYYEKPVYRQKAFVDLYGKHERLPHAEAASSHCVSLPIH